MSIQIAGISGSLSKLSKTEIAIQKALDFAKEQYEEILEQFENLAKDTVRLTKRQQTNYADPTNTDIKHVSLHGSLT